MYSSIEVWPMTGKDVWVSIWRMNEYLFGGCRVQLRKITRDLLATVIVGLFLQNEAYALENIYSCRSVLGAQDRLTCYDNAAAAGPLEATNQASPPEQCA